MDVVETMRRDTVILLYTDAFNRIFGEAFEIKTGKLS